MIKSTTGLFINFITKLLDKESTYLDQIKILDSQLFPWPWTESSWKLLDSGREFLICALFDESQGKGHLIGFSIFEVSRLDFFSHLLKIVVLPEYYGTGAASKIANFCEEELKKMGVGEIYLEVEEFNHRAITFYQKDGYHSLQRKKNFYSNGNAALIMVKNI